MRRVAPLLVAAVAAAGLSAIAPRPVSASTGPYTLPFFNPDIHVTQDYGCTDYEEESWFSGNNAEGTHFNCLFHGAIDYCNPCSIGTTVASARAGEVVAIRNIKDDNDPGDCGSGTGNYILIKHADLRYTLYLHLHKDSMIVSNHEVVAAGQKIAEMGNSGHSCGAHLHYVLTNSDNDHCPLCASHSLDPGGKWTTDDDTQLQGRVPWRGRLVDWWGENTADCLADHDDCFRTLHIPQGSTVTFWYEFKNIGGRTWAWTTPPASDTSAREWRVFLGASTADGASSRDSSFEASDWIDYGDADGWRITVADETSVAPDENGTFTFGLRATQVQGYSTTEHFNLRAESLRWFKLMLKPDPDEDGWEIDSIPLPITIVAPLP